MLSLLLFGGLLAFGSGSKILFEANPDIIQSNLTQTLSMRCSLNDTADAFVGGVVGRRDVTQTASNMQVVTSLVITRNNGEHVATIYGAGGAKALADLNTLTVDGDISGGIGERGYIELTWQPPSSAQVGEYVCEINAVDNQGHNVVFSTSAEIGERQPTIGELMGHILALENHKAAMQSQLDDLRRNLTYISPMTSQCPVCPVTGAVAAVPVHVETGVVECWDSANWQNGESVDCHKFGTPYASPPHVEIGVKSIDHEDGRDVNYDIEVTKLDSSGFCVKCKTGKGAHLYHLWVNWMSIA